jgi:beta-glucanase (GH16 family)
MDLSGYKLTFDDEFNSLSVSDSGPQYGTRWTDHFWYRGNQGGIETDLPGNLSAADGVATITAQKTAGGWTGGVLSSVDSEINGFTQTYGYFEMRAQMPSGSGAWPAFWLISADHAKNYAAPASELDIFEGQGNQTSTNFTTMHSYANGSHWQNADNAHQVADTSQGYHTYGLSWTPETVTWYYDGQALRTLPTQADQHVPMLIHANLGIGNMWGNNMPNGSTPDTMGMKIDYIRAFSNDPGAQAVALDHVSSPDGADTTPYGATDAQGVITGEHATAEAVAAPPAAETAPAETTQAADSAAAATPTPAAESNAAPEPTSVIAADAGEEQAASSGDAAGQLTLRVSGDHGPGDAAQFVVTVDGKPVGDVLSTTASHGAGETQDVTVNLGAVDPDKAHDVAIRFVNDAFDGSHETDRNLYVHGLEIDGKPVDGSAFAANDASLGHDAIDPHAAVMVTNGTATYHVGADYWHHAA